MTGPVPGWPGLRGLLLAAGGSSRLGQPKQTVPVEGVPLVRRTAEIMARVCDGPVTVVLGADSEQVARCLAGLDVILVRNDGWRLGLAGSLSRGLLSLSMPCRAALVVPCDLPYLEAKSLQMLADAWSREPDVPAAASYDGLPGTPAILPAPLFRKVSGLAGDTGARLLLRRPGQRVNRVAIRGANFDLDHQEDLAALRSSRGGRPRS